MKKKKPNKRNILALMATKRGGSGSHTKPYKSQRGKMNREGWDD